MSDSEPSIQFHESMDEPDLSVELQTVNPSSHSAAASAHESNLLAPKPIQIHSAEAEAETEPHHKITRHPTPKAGPTSNGDRSPSEVDEDADTEEDDEVRTGVRFTLPPDADRPSMANGSSSSLSKPGQTDGTSDEIPKAIPLLQMSRSISDQTAVRKNVRFLPGSGGSTESESSKTKQLGSGNSHDEDETETAVRISVDGSPDESKDQNEGGGDMHNDDIRVRGIPEDKHIVYRLLDPTDMGMTFREVESNTEQWTPEMMREVVRWIRPHDLTGMIRKGLRLSNTPLERNITISCRNLSYTDEHGLPRLQGITAYIRPKMMMCILGGPDAGITTFLDVLAGRQKGGVVSGELLCDGKPFTKSVARSLGYVIKDDTNLPTLTVRETLLFAGGLRLPAHRPELLNMRVEIVLKFMGMLHVADSIVGNATIRGISGGEKRRLSYACEIMGGHASVIADLPTNGLDSASAYSCLDTIQKGCMAGRSMACSLVQPSPELFRLFSHVLVLSKGAQLYFGPSTQVDLYFGHHGFKRPLGKELPDFLEELSSTPGKFYVGIPPPPVVYLQRVAADPSEAEQLVDIDSLQATASRLAKSPEFMWSHISEEDAVTLDCAADDQINAAVIETSVNGVQAQIAASSHNFDRNTSFRQGHNLLPPTLHGNAAVRDSSAPSPGKKLRGLKKAMKSFAIPEKEAFDVPFSEMEALVQAERDLNEAIKNDKLDDRIRDEHRDEMARRRLLQRKWIWMIQCYRRSPIYERIGARMFNDMLTPKAEPIPFQTEEEAAEMEEIANEKDGLLAIEDADADPGAAQPKKEQNYLPGSKKEPKDFKFHSSLFKQIVYATKRQWTITVRNPAFTKGAFLRNTIMGLLIGSLFYHIGNTYSDARTRFGLFYFVMTFCSMNTVQMIPQLMEQRSVYYHQVASGYFNGIAYYLSFILTSVPFAIVEIFIFLIFVYPMSNLRGGVGHEPFFYTWILLFFLNMTTRAWVLFISSISKNQTIAQALCPVSLVLLTIFSGYMVPRTSIPNGWIWMYYLSPFTYTIKGLVINELWGTSFECVGGVGTLPSALDPRLTVAPPLGFGGRTTCTINDGHDVLKLYDMDVSEEVQKWYMMLWLVLFFIGFNVLSALALLYVDHSGGDNSETPNWNQDVRDKSARVLAKKRLNSNAQSFANSSTRSTGGVGETRIPMKGLVARQSSILAPEAYLTFNNVCYTVTVPRGKNSKPAPGEDKKTEQRRLLTNCFGFATPRNMTCLMGPSGAGKSTLLDVLAGKKTGGIITGDILINGKPRDVSFSHISGYVEQFDSHDPLQTIREAIEFSATLRLDPSEFTDEQRHNRVEDVIDALNLRHVQDHLIGTEETGGISPELRKKTTIAVELVMAPSLLFLDEPTTGLDSAGALAVMRAVHKLAQNISVICTIHQPSAEIVSLFESILLLKSYGEVAYFGPIVRNPHKPDSMGVIEYFEDENLFKEYLNSVHPPRFRIDKNRADFALESIRAMATDVDESTGKPRVNPATVFLQTQHATDIKKQLDEGTLVPVNSMRFRTYTHAEATNGIKQFVTLLQRFNRSNYRNFPVWRSRFMVPTILSLLLGTLYFQLGFNQFGLQNRISLLYLTVIFISFSAAAFLPGVFAFRAIFFRETQSHMYSSFPFWSAKIVAEVPYVCIEVMLYSLIMYWIAGLTASDTGGRWGYFILTLFGTRFAALGFCEAMGRFVPDIAAATALISVLNTIFMLFTGFLIQKHSIPAGWSWMYYVSFFRYPLSFLASNELRDGSFYCTDSENKYFPTSAAPANYVCTGPLDTNCLPVCPYTRGTQILDQFSMDYDSNRNINIGVVFIFVGGFQILNLIAIKFINHVKR